MKKKCAVCHKSDKRNQMYQDGYYPDVWVHLKCLNTDKAKQWREKEDLRIQIIIDTWLTACRVQTAKRFQV